MHCQKISNAKKIVVARLHQLDENHKEGLLKPTAGLDDFIYVFSCGAGKHSESGVGLLKTEIYELCQYDLQKHCYLIYSDGLVLVRYALEKKEDPNKGPANRMD